MIRELTISEVQDVSGGNPAIALPAAIGCIGGAVANIRDGGQAMAGGCMLGAGAAVTGGMAIATSGFTRLGWAIRSVGLTGASGAMA